VPFSEGGCDLSLFAGLGASITSFLIVGPIVCYKDAKEGSKFEWRVMRWGLKYEQLSTHEDFKVVWRKKECERSESGQQAEVRSTPQSRWPSSVKSRPPRNDAEDRLARRKIAARQALSKLPRIRDSSTPPPRTIHDTHCSTHTFAQCLRPICCKFGKLLKLARSTLEYPRTRNSLWDPSFS
jgi:hypothetical protein